MSALRGIIALAWAVGCVLLVPGALAAQCGERFDWKVSPDLVDPEGTGVKFGLSGAVDACFIGHELRSKNPRSWYVEIDGRALWVADDARVPEAMGLTVRAGGSLSWRDIAPPDPGVGPGEAQPLRYDRGFYGVGLQGGYESSSDREEQAISGGAQFRFVRVGWWWAPSVVATFEFVKPTRSESRGATGEEKDAFRRVTARGYWVVPIRIVEFELDAAAFRSYGLEDVLENLGWETGSYIQGSVVLNPDWRLTNRFKLERLAVSYSDGQLPSASDERKAWTVSLEFGGR